MIARRPGRRDAALLTAGLTVVTAVWLAGRHISWMIVHPSFLTGYVLVALLLASAMLALRKRLPGMPIGIVSTWLKLHVTIGLVILPIFWLHIGRLWPNGLFEQGLAGIFYALVATGAGGRLLQKILPQGLATAGGEVILERIPGEIISLRGDVERLLVACSEETGKTTLAMAYEQTLAWYFRRPRFFVGHVMGMSKARHWFDNRVGGLERSLDAVERGYLDRIRVLAESKHVLDYHYTLQSLLRGWLFLHVPIAAAFYVLAGWHVVLVHVYAQ